MANLINSLYLVVIIITLFEGRLAGPRPQNDRKGDKRRRSSGPSLEQEEASGRQVRPRIDPGASSELDSEASTIPQARGEEEEPDSEASTVRQGGPASDQPGT